MRQIRGPHDQFDSPKSHFIGPLDRILYQFETQGPSRVRRPLTTGFEIQSCSNVSQKCSHNHNRLAEMSLRSRSAQGACHRRPNGDFPGSLCSPVLSTIKKDSSTSRCGTVQAATAMSQSLTLGDLVSRFAKPILCSTHTIKARCKSPSS